MPKGISTVLIILGIVLLVVALGADMLGIGGAPGIGYKQIIGAVAGAALAVVGFVLSRRK
jgi:hypothetical protein